MAAPITIDIWSDIACPWCYIGKRRLESALGTFSQRPDAVEVAITYHSFELSPDTPVDFDGTEVDFLVGHKHMGADRVAKMLDDVTGIARSVGLDYRFDVLQHTNTVRAHQLLHLAKANGVQLEMAERLFRAYFTEGRHLGRIDELARLGADVGLDPDEVTGVLDADGMVHAVRADQEQALRLGITGVPFHVVEGRYGISGAQAPEAFLQVLERVVADRAAEATPDVDGTARAAQEMAS